MGGNIKWVSLQDSDRLDRLYISDTAAKITSAGIANSSAKMQPAGTVVLSRDAGVGKSAIMKEEMAVSQHFMAWTCGAPLNNYFLYYLLQSNKGEFERIAMGNTIKTIALPYFRQLLVPMPTKVEQEAVAAALSDADALIESLEQLLVKKRLVKQGAMQELLTGRRRLPGFEVKPGYKRTEVGMIPEDWEVRSVGEAGHVDAGKALNVKGPGHQTPYLRTKNVLDGHIDLEDVLSMPMTDSEFQRFRLKHGDVLLNEGQSLELVGRCSLYRGEHVGPCAIQNQLVRFRAHPGTSAEFAEGLFRYCQKTGIFCGVATQTTSVAHLGVSRFQNLRLAWPADLAEQRAIASVLSDMDVEVDALEVKLAKARQLKQGMMQELLTGRTRLI